MTTGKRALIVDDSRSARVILSRMLEQHGMVVDTAESAEQALEYLQRSRPDVIFMDHLMPGMDGFQAVKAIKADPLTATIPLMMYTSQEGELYVSQARALGAVGVLPKTVRPVDVSRILYQLHLLPDRRTARTALFPAPAAAAAIAAQRGEDGAMAAALAAASEAAAAVSTPAPAQEPLSLTTQAATVTVVPAAGMTFTPALVSELQTGLRESMSQLVKDQLGEQRRFMLATFEAFARRMSGELREGIAKVPPPAPVPEIVPPAPPRRPWWPVILTALLAAVPAAVLGYLLWQGLTSNHSLATELAAARAATEQAKAEAAVATERAKALAVPLAAAPMPGGPQVAIEYVPYGEAPLAGNRLDRLRSLIGSLESQGFRGKVRVESYVGDFCLSGNASEGFTVADPALAASKCDLVGNPYDDALSAAQRQSVDFANFLATLGRRAGGAIQVEVVNAGRNRPVAYPEQDEKTTAAAWNAVAAQNNRVEFHVLPAA
jgi:CheY-like chemotaxis protein